MNDYNSLKNINVDYDSPIVMNVIDTMSNAIAQWTDDGVMKAVVRAGIDIDKDKLIQVLHQDRERYSDAYRKGYREGYAKCNDEIVLCKDCNNRGTSNCPIEELCGWIPSDDWFCATGERTDESKD